MAFDSIFWWRPGPGKDLFYSPHALLSSFVAGGVGSGVYAVTELFRSPATIDASVAAPWTGPNWGVLTGLSRAIDDTPAFSDPYPFEVMQALAVDPDDEVVYVVRSRPNSGFPEDQAPLQLVKFERSGSVEWPELLEEAWAHNVSPSDDLATDPLSDLPNTAEHQFGVLNSINFPEVINSFGTYGRFNELGISKESFALCNLPTEVTIWDASGVRKLHVTAVEYGKAIRSAAPAPASNGFIGAMVLPKSYPRAVLVKPPIVQQQEVGYGDGFTLYLGTSSLQSAIGVGGLGRRSANGGAYIGGTPTVVGEYSATEVYTYTRPLDPGGESPPPVYVPGGASSYVGAGPFDVHSSGPNSEIFAYRMRRTLSTQLWQSPKPGKTGSAGPAQFPLDSRDFFVQETQTFEEREFVAYNGSVVRSHDVDQGLSGSVVPAVGSLATVPPAGDPKVTSVVAFPTGGYAITEVDPDGTARLLCSRGWTVEAAPELSGEPALQDSNDQWFFVEGLPMPVRRLIRTGAQGAVQPGQTIEREFSNPDGVLERTPVLADYLGIDLILRDFRLADVKIELVRGATSIVLLDGESDDQNLPRIFNDTEVRIYPEGRHSVTELSKAYRPYNLGTIWSPRESFNAFDGQDDSEPWKLRLTNVGSESWTLFQANLHSHTYLSSWMLSLDGDEKGPLYRVPIGLNFPDALGDFGRWSDEFQEHSTTRFLGLAQDTRHLSNTIEPANHWPYGLPRRDQPLPDKPLRPQGQLASSVSVEQVVSVIDSGGANAIDLTGLPDPERSWYYVLILAGATQLTQARRDELTASGGYGIGGWDNLIPVQTQAMGGGEVGYLEVWGATAPLPGLGIDGSHLAGGNPNQLTGLAKADSTKPFAAALVILRDDYGGRLLRDPADPGIGAGATNPAVTPEMAAGGHLRIGLASNGTGAAWSNTGAGERVLDLGSAQGGPIGSGDAATILTATFAQHPASEGSSATLDSETWAALGGTELLMGGVLVGV
ncbi:MAG: hypothetical protein AAGJ46_12205 [Planctomycetota bacterium]